MRDGLTLLTLQYEAQAIATGSDVGEGDRAPLNPPKGGGSRHRHQFFFYILPQLNRSVRERGLPPLGGFEGGYMVKVHHQQARGAHELGAARAEGLRTLLLALHEVGLVARLIEHAHIGERRKLGFGVFLARAMTEDEALGLPACSEGMEALSVAGLQHFVECVVYVVYHTSMKG